MRTGPWFRHWWIWLLVAGLVGIVAYSQLGKAGQTTGGSAAKGASCRRRA